MRMRIGPPKLIPGELEACFLVLKELRTSLTLEEFRQIYSEARRRDQYTLITAFEDGRCLAVMGYRVLYDFIHGKHLYIDDLVVTEAHRSRGLGKRLLEHAETFASEQNCTGLRLCTGTTASHAQKFYLAQGWEARAIVFKKGSR